MTHLPYWLAACYLPNIGARSMLNWLKQGFSIDKLFTASKEELIAYGCSDKLIKNLQRLNWKLIESDMAWGQKPQQHLITYEDDVYPQLLKESSDPPLVLYVRGDKNILNHLQLAIVGSRHATPTGTRNAEQFAYHLSQAGFAITSGLAHGVDGAAHRGALSAAGITIGVSGTGLNHIYPAQHYRLVEKIIANKGAIISEFPLTMPPRSANFPRRNRIISAMSVGVLVIEAALKSGSLITARYAAEEGREVFAIPGSIHNPLTRGTHHLIRQGATLVETVADILAELKVFTPSKPISSPLQEDLDGQTKAFLEKIEYEITPMDVIILRSGLTASEVSYILLALELKGYIQSVPGGYIRIS